MQSVICLSGEWPVGVEVYFFSGTDYADCTDFQFNPCCALNPCNPRNPYLKGLLNGRNCLYLYCAQSTFFISPLFASSACIARCGADCVRSLRLAVGYVSDNPRGYSCSPDETQFSMIACARSFGLLPRRSATPCSVTMMLTSCSLWSTWETIGTMALILPSLATDGQVKMGGCRRFARESSPLPPIPFIILVPPISCQS